jgi:hypothetical protein
LTSSGTSTSTATTSAVPPLGSAAIDLGRSRTIVGDGPSSSTSTTCAPPKISARACRGSLTAFAFAIKADPVRACSLPATSRES